MSRADMLKQRRRADGLEIENIDLQEQLRRALANQNAAERDLVNAQNSGAEWKRRAEAAEGQRDGQAVTIGDLTALRDRLECVADYLGSQAVGEDDAWFPEPNVPAAAYALDLVRWADFVEATGGFDRIMAGGSTWKQWSDRRRQDRGDS